MQLQEFKKQTKEKQILFKQIIVFIKKELHASTNTFAMQGIILK